MKNKTMYAALLSVCLIAAGPVLAQDHNDQGRGEQSHDRNDNRGNDTHGNDNHGFQGHENARNDRENYQSHNDGPRGAGPRHDMRKGQRLSAEYRDRQYVVDDWRGHHLSAPPRGQHWVQAGGDYVLVAIATGVIANIILNN